MSLLCSVKLCFSALALGFYFYPVLVHFGLFGFKSVNFSLAECKLFQRTLPFCFSCLCPVGQLLCFFSYTVYLGRSSEKSGAFCKRTACQRTTGIYYLTVKRYYPETVAVFFGDIRCTVKVPYNNYPSKKVYQYAPVAKLAGTKI